MATQAQIEPVQRAGEKPQWNVGKRLAFRFCFTYLGLYCLSGQISTGLVPLPNVDIPDPSTLWPTRQIVTWMAVHLFRAKTPPVYAFTGSGDKIFDWTWLFCLLVFSVLATVIWSVFHRQPNNYVPLHKWFRLFVRFCLAGQMIGYGLDKVIPSQMPFPYLTRLVEPFGNFSPMGVLWASIGASPAYEIFAGCAELLGGILLIIPRTTTLGSLVCLADMVQVFALNMTYDVDVKLVSFHLILLSLFLLAPDLQRFANLFLLNRPVGASTEPPLFGTPRANRIAFAAQVIFGVWLVGMNAYGGWIGWYQYGGGQPKSALYGIWNVDQCTIDGQIRSPLLTDYDRWRRVIFDVGTRMAFQRMDDSFARYSASIDVNDKTLGLTKDDDKNWKASFTFQRPSPDQLVLDGEMDSRKLHMQLQLFDRKKFLLVSRGFHWVQDHGFNR